VRIDLNSDVGESYGHWVMGQDEALIPLVTSVNIACGAHAGEPSTMARTVALAAAAGVTIGAHPGYPDLQGFGRREMEMDPEEITAAVLYQVGALRGFLDAEGLALNHLKPHGALYGRAARDPVVAHAVADAAEVFGLPVLGMAGTEHERVYAEHGLEFVAEYYADLDYDDAGSLVITRQHEAYDPEETVERTLRAVRDGVAVSRSGREIPMRADTVCIHSDTPGAAELARALDDALGGR
jgi:5-oxoprolinase (ATP-hydrolysing) subunit A